MLETLLQSTKESDQRATNMEQDLQDVTKQLATTSQELQSTQEQLQQANQRYESVGMAANANRNDLETKYKAKVVGSRCLAWRRASGDATIGK